MGRAKAKKARPKRRPCRAARGAIREAGRQTPVVATLPPLPLDHPLAVPHFDNLRIVVPKLIRSRYAGDPGDELRRVLGLALKRLPGNTPAYQTDNGIFVAVEPHGTRIDFNGKFWALLQYDDKAGLDIIKAMALALHQHFALKAHVTQAEAMREFAGNAINARNVLPLPSERIFWPFMGDKVTPLNQYNSVWLAGPRGAWLLRIYSKRRWLDNACKDVDVLAAHTARWQKDGVPEDQDVTRLEIGMSGKQPLRAVTTALYGGTLSASLLFDLWTQRRTVRECPANANTNVSKKTKTNRWPTSIRFAEAMAMPPFRTEAKKIPATTMAADKEPEKKQSKATPGRLTLHDALTNFHNRQLALLAAAHQRLVPWSELCDGLFALWSESVDRRARDLADREASTGLIGLGFRAEGAEHRPIWSVLSEGIADLHKHLLAMDQRTTAEKLVALVRMVHAAPANMDLVDQLAEHLGDTLRIVQEQLELDYVGSSAGTNCDGYKSHSPEPTATAPSLRLSAPASGTRPLRGRRAKARKPVAQNIRDMGEI
ncbi:MAG: hypothetical protein NTZ90_10770 [Proteobacteria bacterium]|nr:hypothetical protein [Pseudomonadota bacterium]